MQRLSVIALLKEERLGLLGAILQEAKELLNEGRAPRYPTFSSCKVEDISGNLQQRYLAICLQFLATCCYTTDTRQK